MNRTLKRSIPSALYIFNNKALENRIHLECLEILRLFEWVLDVNSFYLLREPNKNDPCWMGHAKGKGEGTKRWMKSERATTLTQVLKLRLLCRPTVTPVLEQTNLLLNEVDDSMLKNFFITLATLAIADSTCAKNTKYLELREGPCYRRQSRVDHKTKR
jgi:hypothetical protein